MTHTLNRRSRRPDGPQAADGAPRRPTRLSLALRAALALLAAPAVLHLAPRRRKRFRPARPVTASRRGRWQRRCRVSPTPPA